MTDGGRTVTEMDSVCLCRRVYRLACLPGLEGEEEEGLSAAAGDDSTLLSACQDLCPPLGLPHTHTHSVSSRVDIS